MIKVLKKEYVNEDNLAVAQHKVVFLGVPVYNSTTITSNRNIVNNLTLTTNCNGKKQVKGFINYETENQNQENQQGTTLA